MAQVLAPWTADQVSSLNAYQECGYCHPFTGDALDPSGERVVLIATRDGWVEREGGPLVQEWAHDFMLDWSWRANRIAGVTADHG